MWKLTIKQERKSEHSDYPLTDKVEFVSESLDELTMLVERVSHCTAVHKTTFKIESVGDE